MKYKDIRCLCSSCKDDYETAGYILKRHYKIGNKDRCDKCGRYGWTYVIENKKTAK